MAVIGLITPWNFPVAIPIWKAAPALAWGNVVVHKPASAGMATALRVASYFDHVPGIFRVLVTGADGGLAMTTASAIDALSFTGSGSVGRRLAVACAEGALPFQGEMGGNNASLVLPDADVSRAATAIAGAAMAYAGQKCTATQRIIVVEDPRTLTEAVVAAVHQLRVGDPADDDTVVGPVISEDAGIGILASVDEAAGHQGTILAGGTRLDGEGFIVAPTLVELPDDSMAKVATDEVFGPVCAIIRASSIADAVAIANATPFGLVASVFTADLGLALDVGQRLHVGLLRVNAPTTGVDFHVPFGGDKDSSLGPREQGRAAREFYTSTQTMTIVRN